MASKGMENSKIYHGLSVNSEEREHIIKKIVHTNAQSHERRIYLCSCAKIKCPAATGELAIKAHPKLKLHVKLI